MTDEQKEKHREEILKLALLAQDGDCDALEELCHGLQPLMRVVHSRLSVSDLIMTREIYSLGRDGVMKALRPFDVSKSDDFGSYCYQWIRNIMEHEIRDRVMPMHIPSSVYVYRERYYKARRRLLRRLKREPTIEEIADEAEMAVSAAIRVINSPVVKPVFSINEMIENGDSSTEHDLEDVSSLGPDDNIEKKTMVEYIRSVIKTELTDREVDMLFKLFGIDGDISWTLDKISQKHNVSRARVGQIINRSIEKIRMAVKTDGEF